MIPNSRESFRAYCLRKIGSPVVTLNLDEEQIDDRIDEALLYYADYHFDGTDKTYYKYQITAQDITNQYITLPPNIIGAVDIFDIGESLNSNNMFNIRYQIALNDLYTLTSVSMVPYYMAMQHIQFLEFILVGKQPLRYNRHVNQLHIDTDWSLLNIGDYVIVVAYIVIDPNLYPKVWGDRLLARYATALIEEQFGRNLTKFKNVKLLNGVEYNGEAILARAQKDKDLIEKEMLYTYSLPNTDMLYSLTPFLICLIGIGLVTHIIYNYLLPVMI